MECAFSLYIFVNVCIHLNFSMCVNMDMTLIALTIICW